MRDAEKFKVGFLRKLASMGLTPSDIEKALEAKAKMNKQAAIPIVGDVVETVGDTASDLLKVLGIGGGIAVLGGMGAGMLSRNATLSDAETLEEVKERQLTDEYRRLAANVRERLEDASYDRSKQRKRGIGAFGKRIGR